MADSIIIDLDIDNGKAKIALNEIEKEAKDTSKKSSASISAIGTSLGGLAAKATAIAGAIAGIASALVFKESIEAAQRQEDAVNQLNTSLKLAGTFSTEASQSFQNLASELQRTTTFGDETTLQFAALARNFTRTNEEAERLTKAAIDLSAATGLSLESSVKNLGKTFAGLTGELGESVPALRTLTAEQLKAGAAIDLITQRFGGAAQAQLKTFSGAVTALKNNFGDLLEQIGFIVTKSPVAIKIINDISKGFASAAQQVREFASNPQNINAIINQIASFGQAVIKFAITPMELFGNILKLDFELAQLFVNGFIAGLGKVGGAIGFLLEKLGADGELSTALTNFSESSGAVFEDNAQKVGEAFNNIFDFSVSDKLSTSLDDFRNYFIELNALQDEQREIRNQKNIQDQEQLISSTGVLAEAFSVFSTKTAEGAEITQSSIKEVNTEVKKFANESGKALQKQLAQGAGNAFAQFGKAVAEGGNAFEEFNKALFKSIAQSAVTLGTNFILQGTAYLFSGDPTRKALAPGLISSGAALAAFGGALGAVAGGGATSSQGGGATGAFAAGTTTTETEIAEPEAIQERGPSVQLVVQGDILDSEETGTRLLDILNNNFKESGGTFEGASFA